MDNILCIYLFICKDLEDEGIFIIKNHDLFFCFLKELSHASFLYLFDEFLPHGKNMIFLSRTIILY